MEQKLAHPARRVFLPWKRGWAARCSYRTVRRCPPKVPWCGSVAPGPVPAGSRQLLACLLGKLRGCRR